ncbi:MAG: hypothetical protein V1848_02900 [Candidatus Magasanikbacteria bacterium]
MPDSDLDKKTINPDDEIFHVQEQNSFSSPEQQSPSFDTSFEQADFGYKENPEQDQQMESIDSTLDEVKKSLSIPQKVKNSKIPQVRDEITKQIEQIMEEGLADAFKELSVVEQQQFKMKGEEVALELRVQMKKTKVKMKKIFQLLFDWLRLLPGINKLYLRQEAKIKADKIMNLRRLHEFEKLYS